MKDRDPQHGCVVNYQTKGIHDIFDAWNPVTQNLMNVLFQMPTGTGKTTVFSEIVARARLKDKKILIVVHRKELMEQIVERLRHFEVQALYQDPFDRM